MRAAARLRRNSLMSGAAGPIQLHSDSCRSKRGEHARTRESRGTQFNRFHAADPSIWLSTNARLAPQQTCRGGALRSHDRRNPLATHHRRPTGPPPVFRRPASEPIGTVLHVRSVGCVVPRLLYRRNPTASRPRPPSRNGLGRGRLEYQSDHDSAVDSAGNHPPDVKCCTNDLTRIACQFPWPRR